MTARAAGCGADDRLLLRNAHDTDIQETSKHDAEKEKEGDDHISTVPQENGCLKQGHELRVGWLTGAALTPFAGTRGQR